MTGGGDIKPISMRDVADRAGVSIATVSNVLNKPERVSRAISLRVQRAITDLGYVRNESARTLRTGRSKEIGLIVTDIRNPFFTDVAEGADDAAAKLGDVVMLCSSKGSSERLAWHLQRLASQRVKGILVNPLELEDLDLPALVGDTIPVVLIARRAPGHSRCSVSTDDVAGGETAAQHLIDQNHRKLAFIGGFPERLHGVRLAIAAHNGPAVTVTAFDGPQSRQGGRLIGDQIAAMNPAERPTGIICGNDIIALGVLQAMTVAKIAVPEQVAIIGYDDIDYAAGAAVPLTSIRQPRAELGRVAMQLLHDEVEDPENHRHRSVVFPPELIVRTSSQWIREDSG